MAQRRSPSTKASQPDRATQATAKDNTDDAATKKKPAPRRATARNASGPGGKGKKSATLAESRTQAVKPPQSAVQPEPKTADASSGTTPAASAADVEVATNETAQPEPTPAKAQSDAATADHEKAPEQAAGQAAQPEAETSANRNPEPKKPDAQPKSARAVGAGAKAAAKAEKASESKAAAKSESAGSAARDERASATSPLTPLVGPAGMMPSREVTSATAVDLPPPGIFPLTLGLTGFLPGPLSRPEKSLDVAAALGEELTAYSHQAAEQGAAGLQELAEVRTLPGLVEFQTRQLRKAADIWMRHAGRMGDICRSAYEESRKR